MLLERITSPQDVKALDPSSLPQLCTEIRRAILMSSASVGGHIGSNLGVVELTVALHRVFDSPTDKLIFDVSHQTYTHKMLTGRASNYLDPACYGQLSGFSNPLESEHDLFSMGHTSTSVSLACGMAKARDLAGEMHQVVAVIGDGSLSGGLALEGLDSLAELGSGVIVVVNDNGWSIAENHGGLYRNLAELRESAGGAPCNLFRAFGLDYRFVANGNDEAELERVFTELRNVDHPVVVHVCTTKGAGYEPATADSENWHHVGPFDVESGTYDVFPRNRCEDAETYAGITGSYLLDRMKSDASVVAISAATPYIMGFTPQRRAQAGEQFVDVGIAEEHAATYAAGLARAGAKPVLGLYGVFMQRAYDEFWHDICLNNLPVVILDFGSSVYGTADATHLSFFDLALMGGLPNLRCLAPVCREEYVAMLDWALAQNERPVVIRVPGNGVVSRPDLMTDSDAASVPVSGVIAPLASAPSVAANGAACFDTPRYQVVRPGSEVAVLALGSFFALGERVCDALSSEGLNPTLVNPRFATELDTATLDALAATHRVIVTLEDGVLEGGWGEQVARYLGDRDVRVLCRGVHKDFPDRFDAAELLAQNGTTVEAIVRDVHRVLK
ncbi:MAG: 1-deoxy-D-xylulose-5-phosphate synthase [Coriobacteriaceae bacterium]|nr:1-deoxy-D-xylulose-5-phosphate synthase [Coriobacteriaceae bacterium]